MGAAANPADLIIRNLRALHGALEHSVTIQSTRLQGLMDDLVERGALTRAEADHLVGQLVTAGRAYSQALLQVLDSITAESRKVLTSPVRATAGLLVGTVRQAPRLVPGRRSAPRVAPEPSPAPAPARSVPDAPAPPAADLADLAGLTVAEVKPRLARLGAADLRRVRAAEVAGKGRKGVLVEIDRLLARADGA